MRRSGHPSRPRAITCCFFASLKTLLISTKAICLTPKSTSRASFSLAGFQVTIIGRFWVTAGDQEFALVPADSLACGSTDLKLLNMDMLVPVHMSRFVEPELEDNVFASVTSQAQAEGIQTLNVKGVRCRKDNIRIDGHRHHRCVGSALKQIEITHVQTWILFRKFGIEMMGHRFPPCQMRYWMAQQKRFNDPRKQFVDP